MPRERLEPRTLDRIMTTCNEGDRARLLWDALRQQLPPAEDLLPRARRLAAEQEEKVKLVHIALNASKYREARSLLGPRQQPEERRSEPAEEGFRDLDPFDELLEFELQF